MYKVPVQTHICDQVDYFLEAIPDLVKVFGGGGRGGGIWSRAGIPMLYTEMLMDVMRAAMRIFRREARVREGRRMAMWFIIIGNRDWSCRAQVVTGSC